jgi:hypothetical protein
MVLPTKIPACHFQPVENACPWPQALICTPKLIAEVMRSFTNQGHQKEMRVVHYD